LKAEVNANVASTSQRFGLGAMAKRAVGRVHEVELIVWKLKVDTVKTYGRRSEKKETEKQGPFISCAHDRGDMNFTVV